MADNSLIEWTDATWNVLLGCDKCSEGCKLCYAIRTAWRLQHNPNPTIAAAYAGLVEQRPDGSLNWTGRVNLLPERLRLPMSWAKPRRIFVNSQSDLFHDDVPDTFIDQVFAVMSLCPQHTFQVLTKRAKRMAEYLSASGRMEAIYAQVFALSGAAPGVAAWPLPNVWIGVSVENQKAADSRIPHLLNTPAAVRFLSCEPMLGPVSLYSATKVCWSMPSKYRHWTEAPSSEVTWSMEALLPVGYRPGIHWVICGGESGPGARPMHPDWARSLRDQCQAAGVPFLFKQWGEYAPSILGSTPTPDHLPDSAGFYFDPPAQPGKVWRFGKKAAGRILDGRVWSEFPPAESEVAK